MGSAQNIINLFTRFFIPHPNSLSRGAGTIGINVKENVVFLDLGSTAICLVLRCEKALIADVTHQMVKREHQTSDKQRIERQLYLLQQNQFTREQTE